MRTFTTWAVAVIVIIFVDLCEANTSSIVQSFQFSDKNSETLFFDGFDSAEGKLTSVRLDFSIGVSASGECNPSSVPYCSIYLRLRLEGDPSPLPLSATLFTIASVALVPSTASRPFMGNATKSFYLDFDNPDDFVDIPLITIEMSLLYPTTGLVLDRTISSQEVIGTLTYEFVDRKKLPWLPLLLLEN
jgi:hypothetical protein